jgi:hypothetical protein
LKLRWLSQFLLQKCRRESLRATCASRRTLCRIAKEGKVWKVVPQWHLQLHVNWGRKCALQVSDNFSAAVSRITVHKIYPLKKKDQRCRQSTPYVMTEMCPDWGRDSKEWDWDMLIPAARILIFPVDFP